MVACGWGGGAAAHAAGEEARGLCVLGLGERRERIRRKKKKEGGEMLGSG